MEILTKLVALLRKYNEANETPMSYIRFYDDGSGSLMPYRSIDGTFVPPLYSFLSLIELYNWLDEQTGEQNG
jgi:hypothetical protein